MLRALQTVFLVFLLILMAPALPASAADDLKAQINALATAKLPEMPDRIQALAAAGDPAVVPLLEALAEGNLYFRKSDNAVFLVKPAGANLSLIDPLTAETVGEEAKGALTKIRVNNNLRRTIRSALGGLTLLSPGRAVRLTAAE
ncbi:MAG: urea transporter, permease protein UrtB, partial [Pseudomonadota bacterium]